MQNVLFFAYKPTYTTSANAKLNIILKTYNNLKQKNFFAALFPLGKKKVPVNTLTDVAGT